MDNWLIMYKEVNGVLEPTQYGNNIVPNGNFDKVIKVPEEVARQANKFDFDGMKLVRKDGQRIHSIEELNEIENQYEKNVVGEFLDNDMEDEIIDIQF